MRRFTQIMIACLLVVLLTLVSLRIGTAKAFSPCGSWTIIHSPNPPQTINSRLFGVAAISSDDVWAVGSYFVNRFDTNTLIEHWNGTNWSIISSPNPGSNTIDDELYTVAAISSNDAWAAGVQNNQPLIEHWDGQQWNVVASPNTGTLDNVLNGVSAVSSSNIYAVGFYKVETQSSFYFQTSIERWNGTKWRVVPSPHPGTPGDTLDSVAAVSANNVWAVGSYSTPGTLPLIVHWNGTAWQAVSNPSTAPTSVLGSVTVVPGTSQLWAVGSATSAIHPHVVKTLTEFYC